MGKSANDRRIDYIEMNVADIERSKAFYGKAFGWTFKDYGPNYCGFAEAGLRGIHDERQPTPGGPLVICTPTICGDSESRVKRRVVESQSDLRFSRRAALPFSRSGRLRAGRVGAKQIRSSKLELRSQKAGNGPVGR